MLSIESLLRALYLGLLLLAAAGTLSLPSQSAPSGLVFVILAIWAHAAARVMGVSGLGKALLFLEELPFLALAITLFGKQETLPTLLIVAASAVAGAAILAGEWLLVKGSATFTTSLGFVGASCVAGLGLTLLPTLEFLGLALLSLTFAGYGVMRKVRG